MSDSESYTKPTIIHVWAGSDNENRRHVIARQTWEREARDYGAWKEIRMTDAMLTRSARDFGDPVKLPYIHDMLNAACDAANDGDVLVITNADISLVPGLAKELADKCQAECATFCHRWDFPKVVTHIERSQITSGRWYIGADLFACTKEWWLEYRTQLPPFVLGRECWDWVFRLLIEQTGGSELPKGIYHEKHSSPWAVNRRMAGNLHNRSYARAWLEHNRVDLAEIRNEPFNKVEWPPVK